jgi:hypothetical protein
VLAHGQGCVVSVGGADSCGGEVKTERESNMNIPELSDASLRDLHILIQEHLTEDDGLPDGRKKWGVREYSDWHRQANEYEAELAKRKIAFRRIEW